MLADRVNVIEGIADDLKRAYIPNIFKERGWKAELKYNRESFVKKVAAGALIASAVIAVALLARGHKYHKPG